MQTIDQNKPPKLSPLKWAAGILTFVLVVSGAFWVGKNAAPGHATAVAAPTTPLLTLVFWFFGALFIAAGAIVYVTILATRCFTFDFRNPFFSGFRGKLWFANLITGLFLQMGLTAFVAPLLVGLLAGVLPPALVFPLSIFPPLFAAQVLFIWLSVWAPLELKIIRSRMTALGVTENEIAHAMPIGISDPSRSSLKKLTLIEEDLGLLWLLPDRLIYSGDTQRFEATPDQLIQVERKADAGSVSAYFGAVHVIIHLQFPGLPPRRIRLHPEGDWTMTGKAKSLNQLAERLETWRLTPTLQQHSDASVATSPQ